MTDLSSTLGKIATISFIIFFICCVLIPIGNLEVERNKQINNCKIKCHEQGLGYEHLELDKEDNYVCVCDKETVVIK